LKEGKVRGTSKRLTFEAVAVSEKGGTGLALRITKGIQGKKEK